MNLKKAKKWSFQKAILKKIGKISHFLDIVTKIITLIGGIIGLVSAVSIMFGVKEIRSGMSNDDPRTLDKGIEKVVVGGAVILAIGGVVAYVITQVGAIRF